MGGPRSGGKRNRVSDPGKHQAPAAPAYVVIHLAMPESGILLAPGISPPVACGDPSPHLWCGSLVAVTCPHCVERMPRVLS